jgi:hypothetical protein
MEGANGEWRIANGGAANDLPYSLFAIRYSPFQAIFGGFSGHFALTHGILRL